MGVKLEENMDVKGGTTRVDMQSRHKNGCKLGRDRSGRKSG